MRERLEDPAAAPDFVANTYRQFEFVNRLFARWHHLYRRHLRPHMTDPARTYRLLDIGCGGGDIDRALLRWARRDGRRLHILGIDRNPNALTTAVREEREDLHFRMGSLAELREEGETFDFLISNHVLHELREEELPSFLQDSAALARRQIVFSDVARSAWGAAAFLLSMSPFLHRSFTVPDGIVSLRRAFTVKELRALAPPPWRVIPLFPSRLLLTLRK